MMLRKSPAKPVNEALIETRKFVENTDASPSLTMSYGMLKCPVDSSSTEPGSLFSPPLKNDNTECTFI